jgi:hypothetical protein
VKQRLNTRLAKRIVLRITQILVARPAQRHFDALKRILDRREPDYAC